MYLLSQLEYRFHIEKFIAVESIKLQFSPNLNDLNKNMKVTKLGGLLSEFSKSFRSKVWGTGKSADTFPHIYMSDRSQKLLSYTMS